MKKTGNDMLLRYVIACFFVLVLFLDVSIGLMENNGTKERMFLLWRINCDIVYIERMFA